jgi:ketosteroid isomerase-like protein
MMVPIRYGAVQGRPGVLRGDSCMGNRQTVERINEAFRNNDVNDFLSCCADDIEWRMVGESSMRGKDEIRAWMAKGPSEPPNFSVARVIAEGDFVAVYGDMTMTEHGEKDVPYSYCDIYHFENDKVVELRSYVIKTTGRLS